MLLVMGAPDPRIKLIQAGIDRFNLSIRQLAKLAGMDHSKVTDWINGESHPRKPEDLNVLLNALKTHESTITGNSDARVRRVGIRMVPVLPGLKAGSAEDSYSDVDMIELPDWGTTNERWGRVIEGDSMTPLLEPGDIVIFEDRPAESNHVVHACQNGTDDTVKVLRGHGGTARLVPVNGDYPTISLNGEWYVKGVAVMLIRRLPRDEEMRHSFKHGMRHRD